MKQRHPRTIATVAAVIATAAVTVGAGFAAAAPAAPTTHRQAAAPRRTNPLAGRRLYRVPGSPAAVAAAQVAATHPRRAALLRRIAAQPTAVWYGDWTPAGEVRRDVAHVVGTAARHSRIATLVAYDIVDRDCGGYSSGGAPTPTDYRRWIGRFAAGLGRHRVVVIVEPDALASADCLSAADATTRYTLLRTAVRDLTAADPRAEVYLDAGHAGWQTPAVIAARLRAAGVGRARGFSLNVSNFDTTATETAYARAVSRRLGGSHAVIDTSRNGRGPAPDGAWCNPPGRALGAAPHFTRSGVVDGYLWVKYPGESDGTCNGGPAAGTFWPAYAEQLARNAG